MNLWPTAAEPRRRAAPSINSLIYFNNHRFWALQTKPLQDSKARLVNIRIVEHESASEFLDACHGWLSERELSNHNVLSLAGVLTPQHPIYRPPFLFSCVIVDGKMAVCCIYAEPDGLVLSDCTHEIAPALFEYLRPRIGIPSRIFGPKMPVLQLAKLFGNSTQSSYRNQSRWRIHRLDRPIRDCISVSGHFQVGKLDDGDLVGKWGQNYNEERPANVDIQQFLLNKLKDEHLYFWVDEAPKCLATISGMNCSGPRISAVYTPPEFRSQGYATALVHRLSNMYLESGSPYITLNTEAGDPVEDIYKRLGYKLVGEKVSVIIEDT